VYELVGERDCERERKRERERICINREIEGGRKRGGKR